MTGIERLLDFARLIGEMDFPVHMLPLSARLLDIAEQIEREQNELSEKAKLADSYKDALNDVCKALGLTDGTGLPEASEIICSELDKRLMPPGHEWPRFEDGEKVKDGDKIDTPDGVKTAKLFCFGFSPAHISEGIGEAPFWVGGYSGPIKRPKQDLIGADGLPIKRGETVYVDGRGCTPFNVIYASNGGKYASVLVKFPNGSITTFNPKFITHTKPEPPDSWERIEQDALNFVEDNAGIPHSQSQMERDILDLVRRAKALAERDKE